MATARQPSGTAFALRDPLPWPTFARLARDGEELGYTAVFLPEITGREAFAALSSLAAETARLLLGTGVVAMTSRETLLTAMGAATVHERSGGRLVLGLGTGGATSGALERLRDEVLALRALFAGAAVERRGERARLSLDPGSPVPVWIAALGPRAMRLAGSVADGVLLNWCPPERVAEARERVHEGAEAAGRDPASIAVAVYVRTWVGDGIDAGLEALKAAAGTYASYGPYLRQFEAVGLGAEARAASEAHRAGRPGDVPEALVRAVCAFGDRATAVSAIAAYRDAGADLPVVYPVPAGDPASSIGATLSALAPARAPGP